MTTTQLVLAAIAGIATLAGAILGPLLGHLFGRRAGERSAQAELKDAEATLRTAVTDERKAASADWSSFCDAILRDNQRQADRISVVEQRLGDAEVRSAAAEERAAAVAKDHSIAKNYLRKLIRWIEDHWPGEDYPKPPPELNVEL